MSATGRTDERGYTLIEMLVVLAVMGLVSGIAFPSVERAVAAQQFRKDVAAAEALLRDARATAIARGVSVRISEQDAPDKVALTMPRGAQRFYPDGSADGGSVIVARGNRRARLEIDAATGLIRRVP